MKSLRRSLTLLAEFLTSQPDLGVAELAQKTGLPKGQVSKVLSAFRDHGILRQDPRTRRYSVGVRAYALGARFALHDRLTRVVLPMMRELCERSGHSVRVTVMDGDEVLYLHGIEGPHFVDTGWRAGTFLPPHSTSSGRVLLAFQDPGRAEEILARRGLAKITDATITEPAALRRILGEIRQRGFAVQRGETTAGLATISVPILGESQAPIATLGFAFPAHVVARSQEQGLVDMLHRAARIISQRMGSTVYPFGGAEPQTPLHASARDRVARRVGARR